jgi:hypothetical protein
MSTNYAFQPETVEALATAFHKSWSFMSNDLCFARQDPVLLQRRLSMCLMQLAADGEHDPLLLANAAIYRMRHEYGPEARARLQTTARRAAHDIADPPAQSEATADFVKFALTG